MRWSASESDTATARTCSITTELPRGPRTGAEGNLAGKLLDDVEPVPCPKCGWFQGAMVKLLRREYRRGLHNAGLALAFCSAAAMLLGNRVLSESAFSGMVFVISCLGVVAGAALLAIRFCPLKSYDPNARYPHQMPALPPGSPPALIAAGANANGQTVLTPAAPYAPQIVQGWLAHRLLAEPFVPYCCRCLAPATRTFKAPLQTHSNIPVPLCGKCSGFVLLKWWSCVIVCLGLTAMLSWWLARMPKGIDLVGQVIGATLLWLFSGIIAVAIIPTLFTKPFKAKTLSARRHVYWMKFPNGKFAELQAHPPMPRVRPGRRIEQLKKRGRFR